MPRRLSRPNTKSFETKEQREYLNQVTREVELSLEQVEQAANDETLDTQNFDGLLSSNDNTVQKALDTIDNVDASVLPVDTTNFGGILSSTENTVQKALDVLDDIFDSNVTITDTDAGSGVAPTLDLYRNSASPAVSDFLGEVRWSGEDSAGNKQSYARILAQILDPTSGSEDAKLVFQYVQAGSFGFQWEMREGFFASGLSDPGSNKINAAGYEINGTAFAPPEVFRSSNSAITADSTHTFAHGLSAEPDMVTIILECTTADLNYSVGDRVIIRAEVDSGFAGDRGVSVVVDGTNVVVYVSEAIHILNKSTFTDSAITLASWDMYVKAVYFG